MPYVSTTYTSEIDDDVELSQEIEDGRGARLSIMPTTPSGTHVMSLIFGGFFGDDAAALRQVRRLESILGEMATTLEVRIAQAETAKVTQVKDRLEYLRGELTAERISYGELAELQSLADYIEPDDVQLLEAAGVPEGCTHMPRHTSEADCPEDEREVYAPKPPAKAATDWGASSAIPAELSRSLAEHGFDGHADGDIPPDDSDEDAGPDPDEAYDRAADNAVALAIEAGNGDNWRDYMPKAGR